MGEGVCQRRTGEGHPEIFDVLGTEVATIPRDFTLLQNYPNPFERTTTIRFTLTPSLTPSLSRWERVSARGGRVRVTLKVFDVFGTELATLVDGAFDAGEYSVVFDSLAIPSGVYFYRMQAGGNIQQRAMVLVR